MTRHTKPILTTLTATLTLALAVTSATANRLSVSNRNFRVTWTSLRLTNNVNANTMLCPVTLEGSFHSSTIVKTAGCANRLPHQSITHRQRLHRRPHHLPYRNAALARQVPRLQR